MAHMIGTYPIFYIILGSGGCRFTERRAEAATVTFRLLNEPIETDPDGLVVLPESRSPKGSMKLYRVSTWALKGLPYQNVGAYVYTIKLLAAFGGGFMPSPKCCLDARGT